MSKAHDDSTVAKEQWARYTRARDAGHKEYIEEARKFDAFYFGEQWDEDDKQKLAAAGRPALTINQILPTVNTILGEQASNRATVKFKPRAVKHKETSAVLEKLFRHILDDNQYDWKESEVFADGIVGDRGYFDVRMKFDQNAYGEVEINVEDNCDIIPDPDSKSPDPDTWKEVFKTRWASIDDVRAEYGDTKAEKVKAAIAMGDFLDKDAVRFKPTFGDTESIPEDADERTSSIRSVRIIERQHRVLNKNTRVFVSKYGDIREVPDSWEDERVDEYAEQMEYRVAEMPRLKVRWTVTVGNVVLHDDWSPYSRFTIVPFFPYYRRGRAFGVVRNLISPQEQYNKLESQSLHVINTTANSGWLVEEGSLADGMSVEDMEREGAKTGLVVRYNPGTTRPEKIQPNQAPHGLQTMAHNSRNAMRDISGIHAPMQGGASAEMSGRALQSQIMRAQVQIQKPIDNLARSRFFIARLILEMVQTFYTEERVVYITDDIDPTAEDEELVINHRLASGEVVNDITLGEYSIVISQQPSTDTYQDSQFNEAMQLAAAGVPIPPHVLVEYSHLARRDEIAELLKQQAGMAEPTPEEIEYQQFLQQVEMEHIKLELQRKQAELEKLVVETQKLMAETEEKTNPEAVANQLRIAELQADVQKHLQQLEARIQLASLSRKAQMSKQSQQASLQIRQQDMQQETQLASAEMQLLAAQYKQSQEKQTQAPYTES